MGAFALVLFALCSAPVRAHVPEGAIYQAFQFPDHLVPTIDGNLKDWVLVGDEYAILTGAFRDLIDDGGGQVDAQDFSVRLVVGWNKSLNALFVAARVRDDIHQVDRPPGSAGVRIFQDDGMEFFLDADHSGGQFANFTELSPEEQRRRNGTEASHFVIAGPPPDDDFFVNFSAAAWYALQNGPYTRAAYAREGAMGGPGFTNYELMVVPFDRVDVRAAFQSDSHSLRENEIIGFNVEFNDFDAHSELFDAKWSLSGAQGAFRFADRFADLMLMPLDDIFQPTLVESASWGRIKASFK